MGLSHLSVCGEVSSFSGGYFGSVNGSSVVAGRCIVNWSGGGLVISCSGCGTGVNLSIGSEVSGLGGCYIGSVLGNAMGIDDWHVLGSSVLGLVLVLVLGSTVSIILSGSGCGTGVSFSIGSEVCGLGGGYIRSVLRNAMSIDDWHVLGLLRLVVVLGSVILWLVMLLRSSVSIIVCWGWLHAGEGSQMVPPGFLHFLGLYRYTVMVQYRDMEGSLVLATMCWCTTIVTGGGNGQETGHSDL